MSATTYTARNSVVPASSWLKMNARPSGATTETNSAVRSRSRWRTPLSATRRTMRIGAVIALLGVAERAAGEVEEDSLEIGLDDLDAAHVSPGCLDGVEQPGQHPNPCVRGEDLDLVTLGGRRRTPRTCPRGPGRRHDVARECQPHLLPLPDPAPRAPCGVPSVRISPPSMIPSGCRGARPPPCSGSCTGSPCPAGPASAMDSRIALRLCGSTPTVGSSRQATAEAGQQPDADVEPALHAAAERGGPVPGPARSGR